MFAILAALVWLLAAFDVHLGTVNLLLLGLCFLALHLAFAIAVPIPWRRP